MRLATLDELIVIREKWQRDGRQVVFTNGVFDLLHIGHLNYLERARTLGDALIVGLNSDASTRALKGPRRPLVPQRERATLLSALRCVDYVTIFDEPTATELVTALYPDMYVKGGDYALPDHDVDQSARLAVDESRLPEAQVVRRYGGEVVLLPYLEGYSTTALIQQILSLYRDEAG
ncbi:MAG: adenylyltransferase/cytidyltransferase family protein [Chloroflexaceae bacterium]|nr:adenylyltransferase/cytidyltransferase family protein [Chloroflexaceae bacterium]NJO05561.1 adenylyltransferase/cytidyltransferase family protein [Chloroflexaceae bacterium]